MYLFLAVEFLESFDKMRGPFASSVCLRLQLLSLDPVVV